MNDCKKYCILRKIDKLTNECKECFAEMIEKEKKDDRCRICGVLVNYPHEDKMCGICYAKEKKEPELPQGIHGGFTMPEESELDKLIFNFGDKTWHHCSDSTDIPKFKQQIIALAIKKVDECEHSDLATQYNAMINQWEAKQSLEKM